MNDPHVLRYVPWFPSELREGLVDPVSEWVPIAGGTTLHVFRHPATSEPIGTVVLLHGGGGHGRMLSAVGVLAQQVGAEALAPDLPLYGHTVVPDRSDVRYRAWVEAGVELVERVRVPGRPIVLFGASMGGRLALDVAHQLGAGGVDAVVATCLLDPRRADVRQVVARHPLVLSTGMPLMRAGARLTDRIVIPMRWIAPMEKIANDPDLARACATDPLGAGTSVPLGFLRSWLEHDPGYEPGTFDACPVVLAHPGEDRWTPVEVSRSFLEEMAVPTEMVLLEGCGHFPVEPGAVPGAQAALQAALAAAGLTLRPK